MSLRSPKHPYRVEIHYDEALEFGNSSSYSGESVDDVTHLAIMEIKRCKSPAQVTIWHNAATYPEFDWQVVSETYYKANGIEDVSRSIGASIAKLRREAGLTQTQLAEKCGMAQPNIARIEAGTYATSIDVLSRIAEALGKRIELV